MINVTIRQGNHHDFPAILALIKDFSVFQKASEKVTITVEQMNKEKDLFKCLVAETADGEIIGFASFFFAYYSWSGKALYLDDLYVKEQYRQHKIGSQLFNTVIELAKNNNCQKLRWQVSNWNTNAINFYKKMGAIIDEVEINCDLNLK